MNRDRRHRQQHSTPYSDTRRRPSSPIEAYKTDKGILEIIREKKLLTEAQIAEMLDPVKLTNLAEAHIPSRRTETPWPDCTFEEEQRMKRARARRSAMAIVALALIARSAATLKARNLTW